MIDRKIDFDLRDLQIPHYAVFVYIQHTFIIIGKRISCSRNKRIMNGITEKSLVVFFCQFLLSCHLVFINLFYSLSVLFYDFFLLTLRQIVA